MRKKKTWYVCNWFHLFMCNRIPTHRIDRQLCIETHFILKSFCENIKRANWPYFRYKNIKQQNCFYLLSALKSLYKNIRFFHIQCPFGIVKLLFWKENFGALSKCVKFKFAFAGHCTNCWYKKEILHCCRE